jgi:glycosyl transferase family 25
MSAFTNSIVDKVYVINLDKDTDRLDKVDKQLKDNGIQYERFPGILGVTVGTNTALSRFCNQFCTDGMKGCALSHNNIWKKMIADGHSAVLVFEDDISLSEDFDNHLKKIWSQVPNDFDIVYLGCQLKCGDNNIVPTVVNKVFGQSPEPVNENVLRVKGSSGFYGYIISNRAARKLLMLPIHTHIDVQLQIWIQQYKLNAYSVSPLLVHHISDGAGSNLSEVFPVGINTLLKHITIGDEMNLAWALAENSLKLGPFNVNIFMLLAFILVVFLPITAYKWVFAWILLETLLAKDLGSGIKYAAFLSLPMVIKLLWRLKSRRT